MDVLPVLRGAVKWTKFPFRNALSIRLSILFRWKYLLPSAAVPMMVLHGILIKNDLCYKYNKSVVKIVPTKFVVILFTNEFGGNSFNIMISKSQHSIKISPLLIELNENSFLKDKMIDFFRHKRKYTSE